MSKLDEVFKVLDLIEETSSRNDKKSLLKKYEDLPLLKDFLMYACNPRWIYGIGTKSIKQFNATPVHAVTGLHQKSLFSSKTKFTTIFDLCDSLKSHPYGSRSDVQSVNDFLQKQNELCYKWYKRLILKDLKMGCSVKTINQVYNNLIPVFEVQLAFPMEHRPGRLTKDDEFQIQRKYNGFRFIVYHLENGKTMFFTRNGVELFNFPEIEEEFKQVQSFPGGMVYDGELTDPSDKVNNVISLAMGNGVKTGVCYNVWDCLTVSEFEKGESFDNYFHRSDLVTTLLSENPHVYLNPVKELYRGKDEQMIHELYDYSQTKGWEGVMVKFNTPYLRKRTDNMLKVKGYETVDLQVVRVNEGKEDSKYKGKLGSVTVDYNGVNVNIGGGFSDYQRKQFWENPNLILDKVIEIRFFEQTSNKQQTHSLQHPRFICIREDKS